MSIAIRNSSKSMSMVGLESRSSARFLAASARAEVDFVRRLGNLRQDRDAIRLHFGKSERDRKVVLFLPLPVPQLADLKGRQERRVTGQHSKVALGTGDLDFVHLLVDEQAIGRDDLQLEMRRDAGYRHRSLRRLALSELLEHLVDAANQIEVLFRNLVVLAFGDFLEAADGVGDRHVLAFEAGELLGDEEGL